ncbi:MAG: alanine--tRNA ligase, partial [Clostridia bacterium]|nr:alanine--tRNA ligase [Clostridia bacterium]
DSVGDATHFTFFEMMGNWSLGDYFKKEKTAWTFEFLTEVLGFDKDKICSTVFCGNDAAPRDEETAKLLQGLGIKKENIFYLPKKDNWWELEGTVGTPCGPDNEWFYPKEDGKDSSDFLTSGRYVEIGNDVYMQYKKTATGYVELENKNVDTGFGLDRLLLFLNGLDDGYKTDLFSGAIAHLEKVSGKSYEKDESAKKAMRIIADHTRTAVMLIGDVNGIVPLNTGAGYVLRRLLRRAIRYSKNLGVDSKEML